MREELEARAKGLTNPPVFRFLKTEELVHWYGAGSLCVHASEVEVECMSVLEAMACGLPCLIAHSARSATQQFALSDDYLFESGSLEDLGRKLNRLIDQPAALAEAREPVGASRRGVPDRGVAGKTARRLPRSGGSGREGGLALRGATPVADLDQEGIAQEGELGVDPQRLADPLAMERNGVGAQVEDLGDLHASCGRRRSAERFPAGEGSGGRTPVAAARGLPSDVGESAAKRRTASPRAPPQRPRTVPRPRRPSGRTRSPRPPTPPRPGPGRCAC